MKKYTSLARKGFTLVELMIVIAIIGILAAVLYPAMTGYFERSRDTNRQGALRNVALALNQYKIDNQKFPGDTNTKCLQEVEGVLVGTSTTQTYIKSLPKDPQNKNVAECDTGAKAGSYGYKWIKPNTSDAANGGESILAASMEIKANATMSKAEYTNNTINAVETINLVAKSNPHTSLASSADKGTWYLTMTQE